MDLLYSSEKLSQAARGLAITPQIDSRARGRRDVSVSLRSYRASIPYPQTSTRNWKTIVSNGRRRAKASLLGRNSLQMMKQVSLRAGSWTHAMRLTVYPLKSRRTKVAKAQEIRPSSHLCVIS